MTLPSDLADLLRAGLAKTSPDGFDVPDPDPDVVKALSRNERRGVTSTPLGTSSARGADARSGPSRRTQTPPWGILPRCFSTRPKVFV